MTSFPARIAYNEITGFLPTLRRFASIAALALGLFASMPANAEAVVQIQANMGIIRIDADIDTGVDRKTAWNVLPDYNRWAEFIPDLLICRVISQPGEPIRLEQRGRIPQLPNFPLVMITEVAETPMESLRFQRIAGNIKTLSGEWQIKGKKRVQLNYQAIVEPGFPLPPNLTIEIFRNDAKVRLEALAEEMARRAGR